MGVGEDGERAGEVTRIPDEQLEYYGDCFMRWKIRTQGVGFERFLACPDYYLARVVPREGGTSHFPFLQRLLRLPRALWDRRRPSTC